MSTPSLTQELLAQLQGAPLQQLSRQLGASPDQTAGAVGAALPLLLGALGRNTAQPEGAASLFGALQRDHAGGDLGSLLGTVLGGGTQAAAGSAILGHIFGGNRARAEQGLGQATGLDGGQAAQLLSLLAPIVMSFLANRSRQQGLDASSLGQVLSNEGRQVRQDARGGGLLDAVLDQDGDGRFGISDVIKLGSGLLGSGKR